MGSGGVGKQDIIGSDGRTRVSPTTDFPASAVVRLYANGNPLCTGWLYGPDIVATAGHCVHTGGAGGSWIDDIRAYPGRDGSEKPFGSCDADTSFSVVGWVQNGDERFDYGAIKLDCDIGDEVGWFGLWEKTGELTDLQATLRGYPQDKDDTQWKSTGRIKESDEYQLFYKNDTLGGMSGAPISKKRKSSANSCNGHCVYAIHTSGLHGAAAHAEFNHGTRIRGAVLDNLLDWKES